MKPPRCQRARGRSQAGLSMIEVLAAVLLVSFGILGLLSLLSRASQASIGSEDTLRAALLANEMSSAMWAAGTVTLPATTTAAWNTRVGSPAAAGLPNGTGAITAVDANTATVTVNWTTTTNVQRSYSTTVVIPSP